MSKTPRMTVTPEENVASLIEAQLNRQVGSAALLVGLSRGGWDTVTQGLRALSRCTEERDRLAGAADAYLQQSQAIHGDDACDSRTTEALRAALAQHAAAPGTKEG